MKLELCLLDCHQYRSKVPTFPVVAKITAEARTEIAKKVDLTHLMLMDVQDEDRWFGFSRRVRGVPQEAFEISPERPHFVVCDLFSGGDDVTNFLPGIYELLVRVTIFERTDDSGFRRITLEAKRKLEIS